MDDDCPLPVGSPLPKWQVCTRPTRSTIVGRHCRIVPLEVDVHAEELYRAFGEDGNPRRWTYLPYGPFAGVEPFRAWLETCMGEDPIFYCIIDVRTELPVGLASYLRISPELGVIEVGHIHFSPLLQKSTMATEAMYLMMQHAFDKLGYRRYEWKCDSLNERSRQAALRLGFSYEGLFRQASIYKGRNRDTAWFSIIDEEWPALQAALLAWLDPKNFDKKGQQRLRLSSMIENFC